MSQISRIVNQIDTLDPIPPFATQILALAEDPDSAVSDVVAIIRYDAAITANLLKICNSAYFSLTRKVDSVRDAVIMVGLNAVIELVLFKGLCGNLKKGAAGYDQEGGQLVKAAIASALMAKIIAERLGDVNVQLVYTASLLKDIGKVVIGRYVKDALGAIRFLVDQKGLSFLDAEQTVLGINHAVLGGMIAHRWAFSPRMVHLITHHHMEDPAELVDREAATVYLADTLCMMLGLSAGTDALAYTFYDEVLQRFKWINTDLSDIILAYSDNMKKVDALLEFL